jgi:PAS domain S-box-containing protein
MQRSPTVFRQFAICLALAGLACWLTILVWPLSERFPFAFFLAAVVASAWSCGPTASIFTTALCTGALGYIYYWQSPTNGFELVQENLPRLALFLFTGLLTTYLVRECRGAIVAVDRVHVMLGHLGEALITTDSQGMVRYVNQEAQSLTGCDMREAIGKPLGHVLTLLDEKTRQPLQQPHQTVMARRVAVDLPPGATLQSVRGAGVAVEGRAAPIQEGDRIDGVAITFRDVTRRRAAEKADRDRLDQWHQAAAALPDPVFVKDELGNYVGANAAAGQLVARDLSAIPGAEDASLFSPEVARTIIQADRAAFETGQPQRYQLAVGDGDVRRVFDAVKTPVVGPDGKLNGLVDVFHEVTHNARSDQKLEKAVREYEQRLEEQAAAHKSAEARLRQNHEKECVGIQTARQNSEDSWAEQLAELRRRLDEKTIEHAEAQSLLEKMPHEHSKEFDDRLAAERAAAKREFQAELERVRDEHESHLQETALEEQQRGEELLRQKEQEHSQTVAEYQAAWEASEEALHQAKKELQELREQSDQPDASDAAKQEREELIRRVAEQTAARLGLEESLRRAHEKTQILKDRAARPRDLDPQQAEEIRRLVAAEHEQKANESLAAWQQRLELAGQEHAERFQSAEQAWQQRLDLAAQERDERFQTAAQSWQQRLDATGQERDRRLEEAEKNWQSRLDAAAQENDRQFQSAQQGWQQRLDQALQEQEARNRAAQENWRQTLGDYDRRLTEARNHSAEIDSLRDQLEQSRREASEALREKEQLEELLKSRSAVATNGKSPAGRAAYEAWETRAERPNPDWLSFN